MSFKELIGQLPKVANVLNQLRTQAQQDPNLIRELQKWGLDPTQPPKNPDAIYAWTIVKYYDESQSQPKQAIVNLFGEDEIKKTFVENFNANDLPNFLKRAKNFIDRKGLGTEFREEQINLRAEIQNFCHVYTKVSEWTKSPLEVLKDTELRNFPKSSPYPEEFKALIQRKIELFCGREFVFQQIQQFIYHNSNGYFTIIGDAGMGKSTIAAKYVLSHECPCYFNIRAEGRNTPELFLKSIRQQLVNRYWLPNAKDDNLPTLLQKISDRLLDDERLVIVVDALDEVEQQERDKNILSLPTSLPNKVYFLLTRRPYTQENKRLYTQGVAESELDLRIQEYAASSREDVKKYIWLFLENTKYQYLKKWIEQRKIAPLTFVEQVAEKSENNFMYLYHLLPGIDRGEYNDLALDKFPKGLEEYYQTHWVRMGMDTDPQESMVFFLFILVEISTAIPSEMIAEIAEEDEYDVQTVLDQWVEYLKEQTIDGKTCYSIYHTSFLDFLKSKRELKKTRKLFEKVNQRISQYFIKKMG
ncbi:NACHT domain-containing protein [Iningainema tapete]|uniref:NACHT domain-containing protein n=1 Tax=Iningainema tapete BLCC-T55 TaxID=2748662 RepID=A0A8J6Y2C0_9CYAN|nr:NACHT domain-containing protein [Iningainema tapete]MBD2778198.1 NACHT domain-containing protein [Iningainema tapete BLCC-T55]